MTTPRPAVRLNDFPTDPKMGSSLLPGLRNIPSQSFYAGSREGNEGGSPPLLYCFSLEYSEEHPNIDCLPNLFLIVPDSLIRHGTFAQWGKKAFALSTSEGRLMNLDPIKASFPSSDRYESHPLINMSNSNMERLKEGSTTIIIIIIIIAGIMQRRASMFILRTNMKLYIEQVAQGKNLLGMSLITYYTSCCGILPKSPYSILTKTRLCRFLISLSFLLSVDYPEYYSCDVVNHEAFGVSARFTSIFIFRCLIHA